MKAAKKVIQGLFAVSSLFTCSVAMADVTVAEEQPRVETPQQIVTAEYSLNFEALRMQFTEELQQQVQINIQHQLQTLITELAASVKNIATR